MSPESPLPYPETPNSHALVSGEGVDELNHDQLQGDNENASWGLWSAGKRE